MPTLDCAGTKVVLKHQGKEKGNLWPRIGRGNPTATVAEAFTEQIRPAVERIIASIHESRALAAFRDTLLPKLLSGEIRVAGAERIAGRYA